jgi:hypothetical protein
MAFANAASARSQLDVGLSTSGDRLSDEPGERGSMIEHVPSDPAVHRIST